MGAYTFCNQCDKLLEFTLDSSYTDEERAQALTKLDEHMIKNFGADNWNSEKHQLTEKWYSHGNA